MKYMPLDLSVMQPEPFPHPVMMRSDLYPRRQPSREEKWGVAGACVFGLMAVGVFWLAVEMDNSALQASKSSCSIKP